MDKVKLYAQERLDLDDARDLQALIYDYIQEAFGGLFGHIRGALSRPSITQTENGGAPYIEIAPFQFVTTTPIAESAHGVTSPSAGIAYRQMKTIVVTYEPTEETSTQISIDTARAYYQDYVGAYLWARPVQIDTDTASRIQWSVAQGDEVVFSDETRSSQRVEFAVQTSEPVSAANEAAWAPIAYITSWSDADNTNSVAYWQAVSAFEHDAARTWMNDIVSGAGASLTRAQMSLDDPMTLLGSYTMGSSSSPFTGGRSHRVLGVADQLAILRYKVAQMQGFGEDDPTGTPTSREWYDQPLSSLNGLKTRVDTIFNQRTTKHVCIATALVQMSQGSGEPIFSLIYGEGFSAARTSTLRGNRVCIEYDATVTGEDWLVQHVDCTQLTFGVVDNGDGTFDYNRVTFMVDPSSTWSDLTSDANNYRLDDYATTSGRGVNIELLAQEQTSEEAISHTYGGGTHADTINTEPTVGNHQIRFSIAVYARHGDQT
jgi:hypothetical protein